ncbi:3-keto-disaccharide hydrolase [Paraglaciecola sp.]|uniref:3-keto-disaccharide hydrolase n=1 Tax=Paraglaciecola sp. TaxID=1920173 RepID=UPI003EF1F983
MNKTKALLTLSILTTSVFAQSNKDIDPKLTEFWEPVPEVVTPGPVPSDAIVLFDGTNLDSWTGHDGAAPWTVKNGYMTVAPGKKGISTKQKFCDMQLHIEWRAPEKTPGKKGQQQNNSGVFLQGRYEVQVLDSYENRTYSNGQAGSVYKQSLPLVNAMKPPTHWNTYDIIYKAPRFNDAGKLESKAYVTVLHNGVLVQNHTEIQGGTVYRGNPSYKAHGCAPIFLQDHGNLVSFRNIWVREL